MGSERRKEEGGERGMTLRWYLHPDCAAPASRLGHLSSGPGPNTPSLVTISRLDLPLAARLCSHPSEERGAGIAAQCLPGIGLSLALSRPRGTWVGITLSSLSWFLKKARF